MKKIRSFKTSALLLLALLVFWVSLVVVKFYYNAVYARDYYLARGNRLAWREGKFLPCRGNIADKDGVPLSWSERYFDLYLTGDADLPEILAQLRDELGNILGAVSLDGAGSRDLLLKRNLSPGQIIGLDQLLAKYRFLKIVAREERHVVAYPEVKKIIGETVRRDGVLRGISGAEQAYDVRLRGVPGRYEVMLDPHQRWINGTWRLLRKAVDGENIRLGVTLENILQREDRQ